MSFGKLLATGRSIVGGQDMERYRVNPRVFLPKFISPRNPFVQTPERGASDQTVHSETPAQSQSPQVADAGECATASNTLESRAAHPSAWSTMWNLFRASSRRLNPINLFSRRAPGLKSAIPRFDKKPIQAELSLERVRVLRNDLCEADLEVVTAGASRTGGKNLSDNGAWARMTDRVFGQEAT